MGWESVAGAAASAGMGLMLGKYNDERQYTQQSRLQGLQEAGNKRMMDYSMQKEYEMWQKTGYAAQLQQMKEAGLSPGLIYGMKGGGGITTGSPQGGVSGASAPQGGGEVQSMIGQGMQLELLRAQKENIEADTANKQAQATKTAGVDTALGETQILNLQEGIRNQRAARTLMEVETDLKNLEKEYQGKTLKERLDILDTEWNAAYDKLAILHRQNLLDQAQYNNKLELMNNEIAIQRAEIGLMEAQTDTEKEKPALLRQQAIALIRQGEQKWRELELQGVDIDIAREKLNEEIFKNSNMPTDIIEDVIEAIIVGKAIGKGGESKPPRKPVDPRFQRWNHKGIEKQLK